ncbi:hypothetical protein PINS_up007035 [Pythium insidiosum]|nr:hypothetical protein PINS_up007035 [Pythium insidiosum]
MALPAPASESTPRDVAPFLKQLRRMLDNESAVILRWTRDGRAFEIHDMAQMTDYVLPKYFKHRKYTSFQRQLNYFNFRKWTKSKATVCTFSNEYFQRDRPELAWRITRKKSVHSTASKARSSPPPAPVSTPAPAPSAADSFWRATIHVPSSPAQGHSSKHFLPMLSPTDVDVLPFHPFEAMEPIPHSHASAADATDLLESLDWIDVLLPDVERIEHGTYPLSHSYSHSHSHSHHAPLPSHPHHYCRL